MFHWMTGHNRPDRSVAGPSTTLDTAQRRNHAGAGTLLLGLLGLAATLTPSRSGLGTHQQLGLPPCTFEAILGVRCPTCGMTTSWSHLLHGDFAASWGANPGGTCLAAATALAAVWAITAAYRGVAAPRIPRAVMCATVLAIVTITLIDWASRIFC